MFSDLNAMLLGYDRLRMPYLLSRRSFSKLLAAVPLSRALAAERNMFLSLNSVLLQGRVPWPEFARLAAKIGFPGTDIMSSIFRLNSGKTMRPSMPRLPNSTQPPGSLPLSTARA